MVKTSGSKTIQWDDVRQDIQRLYVKEGQRLEDVRLHLRRKKRFQASIRSYRSKIREWGFKRNSSSCFASSAILCQSASRTQPSHLSLVVEPQSQAESDHSIDFPTPQVPTTSNPSIAPYLLQASGPPPIGTTVDDVILPPHLLGPNVPLQPNACTPHTAESFLPTSWSAKFPKSDSFVTTSSGITGVAANSANEEWVMPPLQLYQISPEHVAAEKRTRTQTNILHCDVNDVEPEQGVRSQSLFKSPTPSPMDLDQSISDDVMLELLDHIIHGRSTDLRRSLTIHHPSIVNRSISLRKSTFNDPKSSSQSDRTLLWWAAAISTPDIVHILIDNGAAINNPVERFGYHTPLAAAIRHNSPESLKTFLERGASVYVRDGSGRQPLHIACNYAKDPDMVSMILGYGAEVDSPVLGISGHPDYPDRGCTALELALRRRGRDYASQRQVSATRIVRMLLEAGADASSLYAQFLEPWKSRKDWGDFISEDEKECLFFFIQAGLDLNTRFPAPALGEENDPEATLGHVLLFHLPGLSMDSFLAQRLTPQPGGNGAGLLPELMNGCRQRPEHVPAAEIVDTLLCRGADRAYSERWGLTSLGILIRTIVERPSHDNMEEEISLLKALLGTPGADPGFPETWSPDCSCPMDRVLSNSSFVHSYPLFAVRVLQTLLERLPDAMTKAPQWQQQSKFLPATENFRDYRLGKTFHLELKTHALLDEFEAEAFLAAAQIVALRQFVELQFSKQREVRNNTDIYFAQKALMHYGVAPVEFPRDLVLDILKPDPRNLTNPSVVPPAPPFYLLSSTEGRNAGSTAAKGKSNPISQRPKIGIDTSISSAPWIQNLLVSAAPGSSPSTSSPKQASTSTPVPWSSFLEPSPTWKTSNASSPKQAGTPGRSTWSDVLESFPQDKGYEDNPSREVSLPPFSELSSNLPTSW